MPSFRFIESDRRITPLNLKKYRRIEFNFELYESVYIENTGNVLDIWLRWTFNVASYRWLQQEVKKKKKTLSYEYFKLEKWFIQQPFADSNTLTNRKEKKKKRKSLLIFNELTDPIVENHHCSESNPEFIQTCPKTKPRTLTNL